MVIAFFNMEGPQGHNMNLSVLEYLCNTSSIWFVRNALTNGFWCLASELQQCAIFSSLKCGEVLGQGLSPLTVHIS
jgi:hypothetical protein